VLEMWYPGDQFGRTAAKLLFGDAQPTGRLPETFPASESQGPGQTPLTFPGVLFPDTTHPTAWNESFDEGVLIGYRYYDAHGQAPLFPFGYGLSYTTFGYGPLSVAGNGDGTWTARAKVTNTGSRPGTEVPQLYLRYPAAAGEAPWSLKGFDRLTLQPGESTTVSFPLDAGTVRTYDDATDGWQVVPGSYTLAVGSSSRDLHDQIAFDPSQPGYSATNASGSVGGTVPATLSLALGGPASFGAFVPGADRTYTASTTATVTSTAGDAALSVSDPGHLANGAFTLRDPLQVSLSKSSWTAPVSDDPVTIGFSQHIGATDPLRTGTYSRTLTFTLSTTNP
jgi:beta-glucosidase